MPVEPIFLPGQMREFLENEVLCCLAVALPGGGVHVAVMRFWCDTDNLNIYMATSKASEKMWWLREQQPSVKASVAIGLTHQLPYSLQMRGELAQFDPSTDERVVDGFSKVASNLDNIHDPNNRMIVFRPTWARYTDRATEKKLMYPIELS